MTSAVVLPPVWQESFHPDCTVDATQALRQAFLTQCRTQLRQALQSCRPLAAQAPAERLLALCDRLTASSALLLDDPVLAIWLRFFSRAQARGQEAEVTLHAAALASVLDDVERRLAGDAEAYVPGTAIAVEYRQLHDYVRAATPPSYDFTDQSVAEPASSPGHSLGLQADLLGYAIEHIGQAWPAMQAQIIEYVRIIGYLPAATFRSCSAARYSGIVYLGNMDDSVLDIEESLVHETGHQVLYRVGALSRLTKPDVPQVANYVLPWSGSRRDLFGYLHAHFIYALLIKYFWRRSQDDTRLSFECQQRAGLILAGSLQASRQLLLDPGLSEQGMAIVKVLADDLDHLQQVLRPTLTMGYHHAAS